jgi:hypothetical protein
MNLDKILQGFKDIADNQALLQEEAMVSAQKVNLNGLKRLHRHNSKLFQKDGLCILNFALDFGINVKRSNIKGGYAMSDLKDHFKKIIPLLEADIESLKKLNFQFLQACGVPYGKGKSMQECLTAMWMKMKFRWLPRFEYTKYDPTDVVAWDKWLHDKIRCTEEETNYRHDD